MRLKDFFRKIGKLTDSVYVLNKQFAWIVFFLEICLPTSKNSSQWRDGGSGSNPIRILHWPRSPKILGLGWKAWWAMQSFDAVDWICWTGRQSSPNDLKWPLILTNLQRPQSEVGGNTSGITPATQTEPFSPDRIKYCDDISPTVVTKLCFL